MGIEKGKRFERAVFVDYALEHVMFRWDPTVGAVYRKFYGESEGLEVIPHDNRLYNDALLFGDEMTAGEYATGKPRP